ncbi:MAG: hypothetical protein ACO2PN_14460, partial [Pyrobaculum sp.]
MYFVINDVKYWVVAGPSGLMLYRKESSRSKYLGRISIAEIKEMLTKADAEEVQRLKAELEAIKQAVEMNQAVESQKTTAQTQAPSLTWRKNDHTYWILQYGASFYIYMKGPSTRHKPRLIEKTDINGVINHVAAADALHVLEALRLIINGLHTAVSDLAKPPTEAPKTLSKPQEAQTSRKEAEEALKELKRELSRAIKKWSEELKRKASWGGPDRKWMKDKLSELINDNSHLVEKILPHQDLL